MKAIIVSVYASSFAGLFALIILSKYLEINTVSASITVLSFGFGLDLIFSSD